MKQLGQTVTVVNKSGVIVKNSKQLINVFKEAKAAYSAKKVELRAHRNADWDEKQARRAIKALDLEDRSERPSSQRRRTTDTHHRSAPRSTADSGASTPRRSRTQRTTQRSRDDGSHYGPPPPMNRGYTDSFYVNDTPSVRDKGHSTPREPHLVPRKPVRYEQDLAGRELQRRFTDNEVAQTSQHRRSSFVARHSAESFDSDLAYGELPPPLPVRRTDDEQELRGKMTVLTRMLEEAHCLQHSATATIAHLQKNPDALAAVALSMAEISNLARKLGPGALTGLARTFPAAMALLVSPQFLIAAGVTVGVTVVMLGGYKVIKRIQEKKDMDREPEEPLRLQELEPELSRIEEWRRGIADAEAESVATTVDGEFVTPVAKDRLIEEGKLRPEQFKRPSTTSHSGSERRKQKEHAPSSKKASSRSGRDAKSKAGSERSDSSKLGRRKTVIKGVKMLFQGRTVPASERQ